jgi:electron-transferring-flavoprotein dehydrogenase
VISRDRIDVDVVIVGAGPSGLAAAIRLKQIADAQGTPLSIVVLEKAADIGAHILSGAVMDVSALDALLPEWRTQRAPLGPEVTADHFVYLTQGGSLEIPHALFPPQLDNRGCRVVSLGIVCKWLGEQAAALGIDILPGFAASELIFDESGAVAGVITGDIGLGRDGQPKAGHAAGIEVHARYTLIAEGARGSLAKQLIARYRLDAACDPQHYGLGIKETWEIQPDRHRPGRVEHHLGWPLSDDTGGGGFVYHGEANRVSLGYVVHLNYANPWLSPFDEMQRWKTHPRLRALLEGGRRIGYGARAMTSGGWQSIPEFGFPGGALVGCSAGLMNLPRIKGIHNAMWSGMRVADAVSEALSAGRSNDLIAGLRDQVLRGPIEADLRPVRNAKVLLSRLGTRLGFTLAGFDLWCTALTGKSPFGTLRHGTPDHATLAPASQSHRIEYPRPDGKLTFDRASSVFLANLAHGEDQPVHLRLRDPSLPIKANLPLYAEPAQRYCPAGVYEIVSDVAGEPSLRINSANCVHCKTCDIKDPLQNIDWVPPEGGSGPNYSGM